MVVDRADRHGVETLTMVTAVLLERGVVEGAAEDQHGPTANFLDLILGGGHVGELEDDAIFLERQIGDLGDAVLAPQAAHHLLLGSR